jgi:hypothetical protein
MFSQWAGLDSCSWSLASPMGCQFTLLYLIHLAEVTPPQTVTTGLDGSGYPD